MSKTDLGPGDELSPASGTLAAPGVTDDRLHRLSVDQYYRMIAPGLLREGAPIELLEGLLVAKARRSPQRVYAGQMSDLALNRLVPDGWFVATKHPVTTAESEPEPGVMVMPEGRRSRLGMPLDCKRCDEDRGPAT